MKEITNKKVFIQIHSPESNYLKAIPGIKNNLLLHTKSVLCASIDSKTRKIKTGLESWSKEDIATFEYELGLDIGSLTSKDFWADFSISIPFRGKSLDLSIPVDRLEYMVLCTLPNVAKTSQDLERVKGMRGNDVIFVMKNSEDEAQIKLSKFDTKIEASEKFSELGSEDYQNILIFMGRNPYNMSPKVLKAAIYEELELNPKRFLEILKHPLFNDTVFIEKCVFNGILSKRGSAIYQDQDILATNIDQTIAFLNQPKNQVLKLALHAALQEKEGVLKEEKPKPGRPKVNI